MEHMKPHGASGFTIVEVLVGSIFVITGFVGLAGLQIANERAHAAAVIDAQITSNFRLLAERVRAAPFQETAALHQGAAISLPGLPSGTGTISFLLDETLDTPESNRFGLPRDLDGDGAATNPDASSSYLLLPVKLEITWTASDGATELRTLYYLLAQEN
jgi:hypothetical protein